MTGGRSGRGAGLLFAFFIVDMLFLPMFHVGPVPFKLGYVMMLAGLPAAIFERPLRPLLTLVAILVLACWIGAAYLAAIEATAQFSSTARNTAILALIPLAFGLGWRLRPASCDVLFLLIPGYFVLNALLSYGYRQLPGLVSFYGLQDRVTSGLFAIRSPGIHYNPNLSALAVNLLFLGLVAADRAVLLRLRSRLLRVIAFASVMGVHFLMGSRGEMLAALAIGGFWLFYRAGGIEPRRLAQFAVTATVAAVLVGGAALASLDYLAERSSFIAFVRNQFTSTLTVLPADFSDPNARTNSILLRPFFEAERVVARVQRSPVWGSGFDTAAVYPFDNVYFHNDWALVLVAGGVIGAVAFALLAGFVGSYGLVQLVPFVLTAPANSFILAPQHLLAFFALLGVVAVRHHSAATRVGESGGVLQARQP